MTIVEYCTYLMTTMFFQCSNLCVEDMTCFEPETCSQLVSGMEFHKFYFDHRKTNTTKIKVWLCCFDVCSKTHMRTCTHKCTYHEYSYSHIVRNINTIIHVHILYTHMLSHSLSLTLSLSLSLSLSLPTSPHSAC